MGNFFTLDFSTRKDFHATEKNTNKIPSLQEKIFDLNF